jgi:hypothetical protein
MKPGGISYATLMLLVCAFPLLFFFILALAGIQLNPLWVPLIMILCCLAMFYLSAGACGHEHALPKTRSAICPVRRRTRLWKNRFVPLDN